MTQEYREPDHGAAEDAVVEGLWDCEDEVRELAVRRAPSSAIVAARLAELRGDPLETAAARR